MRIRIVVADDHKLFIDGICALLENEQELEFAGSAANGLDLIQLVHDVQPDMALVDVSMPSMDGIEVTRLLTNNHPSLQIIGLSMYKQASYVVKMLKAGARGYLLKDTGREELINAIKNVYNGGFAYSSEIALNLVNKLFHQGIENIFPEKKLTEREIDIVKLVARGTPNKIIASELHIAEATVKTHRQRILSKLQLKNTSELIRYSYDHALI